MKCTCLNSPLPGLKLFIFRNDRACRHVWRRDTGLRPDGVHARQPPRLLELCQPETHYCIGAQIETNSRGFDLNIRWFCLVDPDKRNLSYTNHSFLPEASTSINRVFPSPPPIITSFEQFAPVWTILDQLCRRSIGWVSILIGQAVETQLLPIYLQGDHSGCVKPPVDIKTKVQF